MTGLKNSDPAWMRLEHSAMELEAVGALIEGNGYRLDTLGRYADGKELEIAYYLRNCIAAIEQTISDIAEELRQA